MTTLSFKAEGQHLTRTDDAKPAAGSAGGFLRCRFELEGWDDMDVAATFRSPHAVPEAALLEDGECAVPDSIAAGSFTVELMGAQGDERMTTNKVAVYQEVR